MTHQEALTCGAKMAGVFKNNLVLIELRPRVQHGLSLRPAEGDVTIQFEYNIGIDEIIEKRDKIRALGYDCDGNNGHLSITGLWHG